MSHLVTKWIRCFLLLAMLLPLGALGETCDGISPPASFAPVTPGLDFSSCNSRCGTYTPPPPAWNWQTSAALPGTWSWDYIVSTFNYTGMTMTIVTGTEPPNTNVQYAYNPTPGANSLVGIMLWTVPAGSGDYGDIWLQTNQRVFHVGGGWLIKCANNADGGEVPFIIVAKTQVRVGWGAQTPNTTTYLYSQVYDLQPGETPLTFNTSYNGSSGNVKVFGYPAPVYVDSGVRIQGTNQTYKLAGEPGSVTSPMRIQKKKDSVGLVLVDVSDPNATPLRINTSAGVKAFRSYP